MAREKMTPYRPRFDFKHVVVWTTAVVFSGLSTDRASADYPVSVISIAPTAEDVTIEAPVVPARQKLIAFRGTVGTTYDIDIQAPTEPALVMGVGATVDAVSFDSETSIVSITATYNGEAIIANKNVEIPSSSFLIILDPGVNKSGAVVSRARKSRARVARATDNCYGPGASPELYVDNGDEFGDDPGLIDPQVPSDNDLSVGLPAGSQVSFGSTNDFDWCFIPPTAASPFVGFNVSGPSGSTVRLTTSLSPDALDVVGSFVGADLAPINFAIFSENIQVSVDIDDQNGSAFSSFNVPLITGSTAITSLLPSGLKARAQTSASSSVDRKILFGQREKVSIVPQSTVVRTPELSFTGFVDDPELFGETIELVRAERGRDCTNSAALTSSRSPNGRASPLVAMREVVIGRAPIDNTGAYSLKVPSSAIFPGGSNKSNLSAQINGNAVRQSREISLSRQARSNRR